MEKELPLGFLMSLSQNEAALKTFTAMNDSQKNDITSRARAVSSRQEMQKIVDGIASSSVQ